MRFERETFLRLRDSSKSKAMRHMFFAEREVAKIPDISKETIVQAIDGAAVIGSGTMGGGIAMNFANAGIPVFLVDVSQEVLDAGLDKVDKIIPVLYLLDVLAKKLWMKGWH